MQPDADLRKHAVVYPVCIPKMGALSGAIIEVRESALAEPEGARISGLAEGLVFWKIYSCNIL